MCDQKKQILSCPPQQVNPSPIALEPCCGSRAAVLSLLVQLPTGTELYTPVGHPGELPLLPLCAVCKPRGAIFKFQALLR